MLRNEVIKPKFYSWVLLNLIPFESHFLFNRHKIPQQELFDNLGLPCIHIHISLQILQQSGRTFRQKWPRVLNELRLESVTREECEFDSQVGSRLGEILLIL